MKKIILFLLIILSVTNTFAQKIDKIIVTKENTSEEVYRNINTLREEVVKEEIKLNHLLFDKLILGYETNLSNTPFHEFADKYRETNKHLQKLYEEFDKARNEMNAYKGDDKEKRKEVIIHYNNKRNIYCVAMLKYHVEICKKKNQYINLPIDQFMEIKLSNHPDVKFLKDRISLLRRMISVKEERFLQFL